jgi:chromosome segregation ATPase/SAM-dependent methyltransferase
MNAPAGPDQGARSPLHERARRLARYLYAADLVPGKRVLDVGCGDGQGAALVADKGAAAVVALRLDPAAAASSAATHPKVSVRTLASPALLTPGGLAQAAGQERFDVAFVPGDRALLRAPGFLAELRRSLLPTGHLIVSATSKEAFPADPQALGYFELLDSLEQAGFGPVAMCGQSPFIAAAIVPFGSAEPPLVLDDSLAPAEQADEYVAICGPARPGHPSPYEVVRLPRGAVAPTRVVEKVPERVVEKVTERVEVPVADPKVVAERDRLSSEAVALRHELETARARLHEAAQHEAKTQLQRREAEAQRHELLRQLHDSEEARTRFEAQAAELLEQQRQRQQRETEHGEAALAHERQMRELRATLEERDAFVGELEEQARELPKLQEKLQAAQLRAEQAEHSERVARQKVAEVEGQLLRARGELQQRASEVSLASELENRQRELEASRRELLVQRAELEQREQAVRRSEQEQLVNAELQAELQRERSAREAAQAQAAQLDGQRAAAERKLSTSEAEVAQLKQTVARLEQEKAAQPPSRKSTDEDGVPLAVGDMPTAPVGRTTGANLVSAHEELSNLRTQLAELRTENERLKDQVNQAERETWKYMKARSEAEQAAAEVREDTVRKLRDARKLASVELTRAMEEATKKAVQLREELSRTEAERKDALGQIKELRAARDSATEQASQLKAELDAVRWATPAPGSGHAASEQLKDEVTRVKEEGAAALRTARSEAERVLHEERAARQAAQAAADEAQSRVAELRAAVVGLEQTLGEARLQIEQEQKRVEAMEEDLRHSGSEQAGRAASAELLQLQQELQSRERAVAELRAERDALGRLLGEVEREAYARAERARQLRVRLSEREREGEALRAELADRDRRLGALETHTPPTEEVARLQTDLNSARRRIAELQTEAARHDQHGDEAVATALRERARSSRLGEQAAQTTRERDEAVTHAGELEQRLAEVLAESNRLRSELSRLGVSDSGNATGEAAAAAPAAPAATPPEDPRRPPILDSNTVQRVIKVGQSLGLEPVYLPQDDESKK